MEILNLFLVVLGWTVAVAAWLATVFFFFGNMISDNGWKYTLFGISGLIVMIAVGITTIGMVAP